MIEDRAAQGPEDTAPEPIQEQVERPPGPARYRWYVLAVVVGALLALPLFRPVISSYNYTMTLGALVLMWVAMSSSWNILGGYAGYISLGHSVFMGIGGYVAGVLLYYHDQPISHCAPRRAGSGPGRVPRRVHHAAHPGPGFHHLYDCFAVHVPAHD